MSDNFRQISKLKQDKYYLEKRLEVCRISLKTTRTPGKYKKEIAEKEAKLAEVNKELESLQ